MYVIFATYSTTTNVKLSCSECFHQNTQNIKQHNNKNIKISNSKWLTLMKSEFDIEENVYCFDFNCIEGTWRNNTADVWLAFLYIVPNAKVCNVNTGVYETRVRLHLLFTMKGIHNAKPGQSNAHPFKYSKLRI